MHSLTRSVNAYNRALSASSLLIGTAMLQKMMAEMHAPEKMSLCWLYVYGVVSYSGSDVDHRREVGEDNCRNTSA